MDTKVLKALQLCPLFAGMSAEEIETVMAGVDYRIADYERHDIYTLTGMPCQHVDIVVGGELICRMSSLSGRQVEVSRLRPGNIVAPALLFSRDNSMPVSVETGDTHTIILRMRKPDFEVLLKDNWQLAENFIRVLSNINVFLTKRLRVLSLFTVREKVAWLLRQRASEQGSNSILLSRSRQEIADSFGIQKFSLLRVLSSLQEDGAIKINGKEITILDRSKLK